jgi:hypothetical protein
MTARHRLARTLDRLEAHFQPRQQRRLEENSLTADQRRHWEETLGGFEAALPRDLLERVAEALREEGCPLWDWMEDVVRGRSRLPDCLTPEVMRRLVLIRLDEADRCEDFEAVCLGCGLQYPVHWSPPLSEWRLAADCSPDERPLRYDLPQLFEHDGCPACGASSKAGEMNWAHLMADGYWFEAAWAKDGPPVRAAPSSGA